MARIYKQPKYKLYKITVLPHLMDTNPKLDLKHERLIDNKDYHSFENDLLSFRFQRLPPYKSNCMVRNYPISIILPEEIQFSSEGNTYVWKLERTSIPACINLSYTYFFESGAVVWHAAFLPAPGNFFSEFEAITLSKCFGGCQEICDDIEAIGYSTGDGIKKDIRSLIETLCGCRYIPPLPIETGIIQWDASSLAERKGKHGSMPVNQKRITRIMKLISAMNDDKKSFSDLEDLFNRDSSSRYFMKVLCGFALNIFDFERYDFAEFMDTIIPLNQTQLYFITMNRGNLTCICYKDKIYSDLTKTIGASPYLIIPNAVLTHNDNIIEGVERHANDLLSKTGKKDDSRGTVSNMIAARSELEKIVRTQIIEDVFHYPGEKNIIDYGNHHRGIEGKITCVRSSLDEISRQIEDKNTIAAKKNDLFVLILLTLVSCLSLISTFLDIGLSIVQEGFTHVMLREGRILTIFLVFTVVVLLTIYFIGKRNMRR